MPPVRAFVLVFALLSGTNVCGVRAPQYLKPPSVSSTSSDNDSGAGGSSKPSSETSTASAPASAPTAAASALSARTGVWEAVPGGTASDALPPPPPLPAEFLLIQYHLAALQGASTSPPPPVVHRPPQPPPPRPPASPPPLPTATAFLNSYTAGSNRLAAANSTPSLFESLLVAPGTNLLSGAEWEERSGHLTLVSLSLAQYPLAVCNDGTPGGYYISESSTGSTEWVVYRAHPRLHVHSSSLLLTPPPCAVEGGMWCWSVTSCAQRFSASPFEMSSQKWPHNATLGGIFSAPLDSKLNPWAHANKVYVGYCSSDGAQRSAAPIPPLCRGNFS